MIIIKVISTKINIPAEHILGDIDAYVLRMLNELYVGKCYKSIMINRIIEIQKRSKCVMTSSLVDGSGSVDVTFLVEGISYQRGEYVAGVEIIKKDQKSIMGQKGDKIAVKLSAHHLIKLEEKHYLPIIVDMVRYTFNQMTITGKPYFPSQNNFIYQVEFTDIDRESVDSVLKEIEALNEKAKENPKKLEFFKNTFRLMRPYTTLVNGERVPIESLISKKGTGYIVVHNSIDKYTTDVYYTDDVEKFKENKDLFSAKMYGTLTIAPEKFEAVLRMVLLDTRNYIQFLLDNMEIYTEELIKSHSALWEMYDKLRRT